MFRVPDTCLELLNDLVRCRSLTRLGIALEAASTAIAIWESVFRIDISCNAISVGAAFQPLLKRVEPGLQGPSGEPRLAHVGSEQNG